MMKAAALVACSVLLVQCAHAEPLLTQDEKGNVTSISGLYDYGQNCRPFEMSGTVISVDLRDDGMSLKGFVLESTDGKRRFVNVLAYSGWVKLVLALQNLSRVGRSASIGGYVCTGSAYILGAIK
jgi:hypothetical protein